MRCEITGCGSGSLDSSIEGPRVEVLEIVVEGGSLLSSTKGLFNFNPEARSSEVGEGDDILLASWRELRDEEKSNGGKGLLFLERKPENRNKNLAFPKEERTFYRDKIGR